MLGFVTNPNPVFAWLIASLGGILLFLFLMRRSREREGEVGASFARAAPFAAPLTDAVPVPVQNAPATVQPTLAAAARTRSKGSAAPPPETSKPAAKTRSTATKSSGEGKASGKRGAKGAPAIGPLGPAEAAAAIAASAVAGATMTAKAAVAAHVFAKPPGKGVERFKVGYRMVRLSEGVDDVGSRELGRLDRGDEVEVIDSFEGFLQVRTPNGIEGWIPRHTILG